jgi:hypothetical protein
MRRGVQRTLAVAMATLGGMAVGAIAGWSLGHLEQAMHGPAQCFEYVSVRGTEWRCEREAWTLTTPAFAAFFGLASGVSGHWTATRPRPGLRRLHAADSGAQESS